MATAITSLPNEVSENKVVLNGTMQSLDVMTTLSELTVLNDKLKNLTK